jgi:hypothetical protein
VANSRLGVGRVDPGPRTHRQVGAAIMDPAHQGLRRVVLGVDLQRRCARHGNAHIRSGDHKLTASPTVQLLTVPSRTP